MRQFEIKRAEKNDIPFLLSLAEHEGWNPGIEDANPFYAADPYGFFIGELNGEKIGCISAVNYGQAFGFLGLYIIKSEYRGKGFGIQLWSHGMRYLNGLSIGLDGVVEQQANYKKSGFQFFYRNIRYEGKGGEGSNISSLINLKELPFDFVQEYDQAINGFLRTSFLKAWIQMPKAQCMGVVERGVLVGYSVIRPCKVGFKIGPLFANTTEIAEKLYRGLAAYAKKSPLFLDVPESNIAAVKLAEKFGMKKVFETARMYKNGAPSQQIEKIYGITTFELG